MSRSRIIAALAGAGLAVGLLAGCGGGGSGSTQSDKAAASVDAEGRTTISMWVFAELHSSFYEEMAAQWNEANPDKQINLEVTVYPYEDMHNKLQLAVNSGEGLPDVVDIEVNKFANFVKGENPPLLDLTEAAAPYRDDIVQARLDLYSRDGKIYGYPTHVGAFLSFYNTELMDAAGIDYTTIETWDDFEKAGAAYKKATGKSFGIASTSVFFAEPLMVAQLGGQFFADDGAGDVDVNNPTVIEAIQKNVDMLEAGAIDTIPGGSPDSEEAYGAINSGDYAAVVYPAWYTSRYVDYMPDLAGKVAIAPAPTFGNAVTQTIGGGGTGTAVAAASPVKDIAAEWLAFAKLSPEANVAVWEVLGFDPVNMSVWEDTAVTQNPDNKFNKYFTTNMFDVLNEIKDGIGHFNSFSNPNLPTVDNWFRTVALNELYENNVPVQQAIDQAQKDLANELGQ